MAKSTGAKLDTIEMIPIRNDRKIAIIILVMTMERDREALDLTRHDIVHQDQPKRADPCQRERRVNHRLFKHEFVEHPNQIRRLASRGQTQSQFEIRVPVV